MRIKRYLLACFALILLGSHSLAICDAIFPAQTEKQENSTSYRPNDPKGIEVYSLPKEDAINLAYTSAQGTGFDYVTIDEITDAIVILNSSFMMGDARATIQPLIIKDTETNETGIFFETKAQGVGFNFSLVPGYLLTGFKKRLDELVAQDGIQKKTFAKYERVQEKITQKIFGKREKAYQEDATSGRVVSATSRVCSTAWNADGLMQTSWLNQLDHPMQLKGRREAVVDTITVAQLRAFYEANEAISKAAGLSPSFIICDGKQPNAFATSIGNGLIVAVTLGMMKLVDGDRDMAAIVIGHEYTHHIKEHRAKAQARKNALGFLGLIVGTVLESKTQEKYRTKNLGYDLARIGTSLISSKFDRDQEREADTDGLNYLIKAGFSPSGAIRLSEKMKRVGGGAGLFFDTHPGWEERTERFKDEISHSSEAKNVLASLGEFTHFSLQEQPSNPQKPLSSISEGIALQATYEVSDAEQSLNDAIFAFERKNVPEGMTYLRKAADAGHPLAQSGLGYAYVNGSGGLVKDEKEALRLFRLSAEQGNSYGQSNLGMMYLNGWGVSKDYLEATSFIKKSVEQGNSYAQSNLGVMYQNGWGVEKNLIEAIRLFRLSAEQGNTEGQANLGYAYLNGLGLDKNKSEAIRWLSKAADQGHPSALSTLEKLGVKNNEIYGAAISAKQNEGANLRQSDNSGSLEEKLSKLKKLHDKGLISDQIYSDMQREVMDGRR